MPNLKNKTKCPLKTSCDFYAASVCQCAVFGLARVLMRARIFASKKEQTAQADYANKESLKWTLCLVLFSLCTGKLFSQSYNNLNIF